MTLGSVFSAFSKYLGDVRDVVVDVILVLERRPERAAHQPEFGQSELGRLLHDVVEYGVGVAGEQIVRFAGADLGEHGRIILGARLEPVLLEFDAGLLEGLAVNVGGDVAERVVLHEHRHFLDPFFRR